MCWTNTYQSSHGWIVAGRIPTAKLEEVSCHSCFTVTTDINRQIEKFWPIAELNPNQQCIGPFTGEDDICETQFSEIFVRTCTGCLVVILLTKSNISQLGSSTEIALKRFNQLERCA